MAEQRLVVTIVLDREVVTHSRGEEANIEARQKCARLQDKYRRWKSLAPKGALHFGHFRLRVLYRVLRQSKQKTWKHFVKIPSFLRTLQEGHVS